MRTIYQYKRVKHSPAKVAELPEETSSPDTAVKVVRDLLPMDEGNEDFVALFLDVRNQPVGYKVFQGTVDHTIVYPRDIIKAALDCNASSIILGHNHPSNVVSPSGPDIKITNNLNEVCTLLGLRLLDNIICADDEPKTKYSFSENGLL